MATLKDVSRLAGVSIASVSRVMNGDYSGVSGETKERILSAAQKLHYRPNRLARSLVKKRSKIVGLLIPDVSNPYYADLAKGVEQETERNGYNLILCNTQDRVEKEKKYLNLLFEYNVDGLILTGITEPYGESSELLKGYGIPYVVIDRTDANAPVSFSSNGQRGTYLSTEYLIRLGHRQIAFIGGEEKAGYPYLDSPRLQGYESALRAYGLHPDERLIREGSYTIESGYGCARELMKSGLPITAFVCTNDLIAFGVIKAVREMGRQVPGDVSVIGYDDIALCSYFEPKLSTIRQDSQELGKSVCRMLLELVREERSGMVVRSVEPELIIRDSTAPPREKQ